MTTINFGSRATVSTLIARLEDATTGNKDGIVGNEKAKPGDAKGANVFDTNPLLFQLRGFFSVGVSKKDEQQRLGEFLGTVEKNFGPVTTAARPAWVKQSDWNTYVVDKAITMVRLGRPPSDCVDGFVKARGSVDGHAIEARDVFTQTWKVPEGVKPSGQTVLISPGFLESGRNYVEQVQLLNKQGHEVVVMDHQWAGLTGTPSKGDGGGASGHIDRGFGIARDVAAVTAQLAAQGKSVTIVGTSMGGGAGAVGAWVMNDRDRIQLDGGAQMPKGLNVLGMGPFFDRTGGVLNGALAASGKIPGLNQIPLPATGAPVLSSDQATLRMIAAHASTEHLTGQAQAFHASTEDLATMKKLLESGGKPRGKIEIVHSNKDTLASYDASVEWSKLLGANLQTVNSTSHVYSESPTEMGLVLGGLSRLGV